MGIRELGLGAATPSEEGWWWTEEELIDLIGKKNFFSFEY
jgi:hypothetical protein